jgi:hypothetical protein
MGISTYAVSATDPHLNSTIDIAGAVMDDHAIFLKLRTKLISISIILWLYEGAGLSFEKINILGNAIDVTYPFVLRAGLWLAGIYWLLRFHQFSVIEWSEHRADPKGDFRREFQKLLFPILEIITTKFIASQPKKYLNDNTFSMLESKEIFLNEYCIERGFEGENDILKMIEAPVLNKDDIGRVPWFWHRTYRLKTGLLLSSQERTLNEFCSRYNPSIQQNSNYQVENDFKVSLLPWIKIWLVSTFKFMVNSKQFLQYLWPYVGFGIAVMIVMLKWAGIWQLLIRFLTP